MLFLIMVLFLDYLKQKEYLEYLWNQSQQESDITTLSF